MIIATKYFKTKNGEVKFTYWCNGLIGGEFKKEKTVKALDSWIHNSIDTSTLERKTLVTAARKLKVKVDEIGRYETDYTFIKFFVEYN